MWAWSASTEFGDEYVHAQVTFVATAHAGTDAAGRLFNVQMEFAITILQDLPADPQTGRLALSAGSSVAYVASEWATLIASENPFDLFPDAALEYQPPQE